MGIGTCLGALISTLAPHAYTFDRLQMVLQWLQANGATLTDMKAAYEAAIEAVEVHSTIKYPSFESAMMERSKP